MCSRFLSLAVAVLLLLGNLQARELRVCADPDNLPFSNRQQRGFENQIAGLLARDLQARLTYVWQRMGRGFVREYLDKSVCDLLVGIPENYRPVLTTAPYYRSSYVFVTRADRARQPNSLNDPELRDMNKIGVQVLDEEYAPPGDALARRGLQREIAGFSSTCSNADSIVRAVLNRQVDAAIVWGPLAGYYARSYSGVLRLAAVTPAVDPPGIPMTFAISMGVRKGNVALRDELQGFLDRRRSPIDAILRSYGVPQLPAGPVAGQGE